LACCPGLSWTRSDTARQPILLPRRYLARRIPMKPLSDITVQNLKPRAVQYEKPDPGARGLRVVVHPTGRKSFIARYRNAAGRTRKLTLTAGVTLAAARKLAADPLFQGAPGPPPPSPSQPA